MPNATAGAIDSILIGDFRNEIRRAVHLITIGERRRVEVTVNGRSDGIVGHIGRATNRERLAGTVRFQPMVITQGIQIH